MAPTPEPPPVHNAAEEGRQRREAIMRFLVEFIETNHYSPSHDEVGAAVGITGRAAGKHLELLHAAGRIDMMGRRRIKVLVP